MMRLTWVGRIGLLLLVIGLIPWASWTAWDSTRTWFLLKDMPVALSNGSHYGTALVKTNMNALYSIYIDADYSGPIDANQQSEAARKLACQIGADDPEREPCQAPPAWKFRWKVSSDGGTVQGNSDETIGQGYVSSAGNIEREIGAFRTKSGHSYKFDLEVLFDNHDTKIVNPRLMVAVADYHTESSLFFTGLLRLVCVPIAIIGAFLIFGSLLSQRARRKRALVLDDSREPCEGGEK